MPSMTADSGMQPNSSGSGRSPMPSGGKKPFGSTPPCTTFCTSPATGPSVRERPLGCRFGITKPPLRSPCLPKSSLAMSFDAAMFMNTWPVFGASKPRARKVSFQATRLNRSVPVSCAIVATRTLARSTLGKNIGRARSGVQALNAKNEAPPSGCAGTCTPKVSCETSSAVSPGCWLTAKAMRWRFRSATARSAGPASAAGGPTYFIHSFFAQIAHWAAPVLLPSVACNGRSFLPTCLRGLAIELLMKISGSSNWIGLPSRSVPTMRNLNGAMFAPLPSEGQNISWPLPGGVTWQSSGLARSGVTVVSMRTWVNGKPFFTASLSAPYGLSPAPST